MPIVETRNLSKRYGSSLAVKELTLSVESGEIFGLLGPNGAGKSTTLKMLTTLIPPTSGGALVGGCDIVRQANAVRRIIGYVPQLLSADGALSGFENLLIFSKLYEVPRAQRRARIEEALEVMGLSEFARKLVRTYSGGMIRRLEIAQAMVYRPKVLFLDEPTVGLDPVARQAVWERIGELRTAYGMTIVLTTHYMEEADDLCSRVGILHLGEMMALGTPAELKASLRVPDATLDDVFVNFAGTSLQTGGSYRDTRRARRTARRLG